MPVAFWFGRFNILTIYKHNLSLFIFIFLSDKVKKEVCWW